jgi:type IV pilus assembly protein PilP
MTSQYPRRKWYGVISSLVLLSLAGGPTLTAQEQANTIEETYRYPITGKRDPFLPPFPTTTQESEATDEPRTPLQRFDLGQLKLVGVIWETDEPRALVEDSGGLGYIVTRGTLIGSRGGIVKKIEPKRVIVEEYETDFFGKRQTQEKELRITVTSPSPSGRKQEQQ